MKYVLTNLREAGFVITAKVPQGKSHIPASVTHGNAAPTLETLETAIEALHEKVDEVRMRPLLSAKYRRAE